MKDLSCKRDKIYIVKVSTEESDYESIEATFDSLEDAKEYAEKTFGYVTDYREIDNAYNDFNRNSPEADRIYELNSDDNDIEFLLGEQFLKEHPEFSREFFNDYQDNYPYHLVSNIGITELTLGIPAITRTVCWAYAVNPNNEDDPIKEFNWIEYGAV